MKQALMMAKSFVFRVGLSGRKLRGDRLNGKKTEGREDIEGMGNRDK